MKPLARYDLEDLLKDLDAVEPPAGLAESIKADIPEDLTLPSTVTTDVPASPDLRRNRTWLHRTWLHRTWLPLAATLLAFLGGGYLTHRILVAPPAPPSVLEAAREETTKLREAPDPEAPAEESVEPAAPAAAPAAVLPADRRPQSAVETPSRPSPEASSFHRDARAPGRQETLRPPAEAEGVAKRIEEVPQVVAEAAQASPPPPPASPPPPPAPARPEPRWRPAAEPMRSREQPTQAAPESQDMEEVMVVAEAPVVTTESKSSGFLGEYSGSIRADQVGHYRPLEGASAAPSTGGTAEPNDGAYGDVFFEGYGTNPFIDTEDDRLSTFGLDVDTASYTVVRRYLSDGHLPPSDAVRVEELVNYFDYGDAPPQEADFALHAEGAPSPFADGDRYYLLRLNLRGREVAAEDRPPAVLTFVVDVSGSMNQQNRLGLVQQALGLLVDELRADDRIALVTYGSQARVVLPPTGDRHAVRRALMDLRPGGSTNAEDGLRLAYELAARHRQKGAIHRIILCSDGVANVGRTGPESILEQVQNEASKGIELTTVGFGMGNYNDVLMEQLANRGNGRYAYVDTLDEAHRIFVEDLTGTLMTLAAEARTQVEFNEEVVARYRLLGYENRDIADDRFRDDTVDAGEIGAGHRVTALYEIKLHRDLPRLRAGGLKIATLRLRYGSVAQGEMVEQTRIVTGADFVRKWEKASSAFRLTTLVAEFSEILRGSYWAREGDLEEVFRQAQSISGEYPGDRDVAEFVSLVGRAADYSKRH